jgi:DNA-binding NtrC family response regulator
MEDENPETKLSVLVVDDCGSIRELLKTLLLRKGHRCESAETVWRRW